MASPPEPRMVHDGPLSAMEKLSPEVFLLPPSPSLMTRETRTYVAPPRLILMNTWSGALDSHMAQYIAKYHSLYPTSQILLVKSTRKLFFNPSLVAKAIKPAVPIMKACFPAENSSTPPPAGQPGLLIHTFSMGGVSSLVRLIDAYSSSGEQLPPHVKILDSCPATFSASRLVAFLNLPLPFPIRIALAPIIYTISYTWGFLVWWGVFSDPLKVWGHRLNSDINKTELGRAYIYSDMDELVDPASVEGNSDEAERLGFTVARREKFKGSKHVAHARKDEECYWRIVEGTWTETFGARL